MRRLQSTNASTAMGEPLAQQAMEFSVLSVLNQKNGACALG